MKAIEEINRKIVRDEAIILTAAELKSMVRDGQKVTLDDVDVVTTGTFGVMSGTMAVMMVPPVILWEEGPDPVPKNRMSQPLQI